MCAFIGGIARDCHRRVVFVSSGVFSFSFCTEFFACCVFAKVDDELNLIFYF